MPALAHGQWRLLQRSDLHRSSGPGPELVAIDPNSGASLWTLATTTRVGSLTIAADGGSGYLLADGQLVSVDLTGHRICQTRTLPETPRALALSGDGSRLFVLTTGKEVLVVEARELSCGASSPTATRPICRLASCPSLHCADREIGVPGREQRLRIALSGRLVQEARCVALFAS